MDSAMNDLKEARESVTKELTEMSETRLSIVSASYNNTTSVLVVTMGNEGSNVIPLEDLDLLLNGTYVSRGTSTAGYIYPGQTHSVNLSNVTDPRSVKVVGPWGISDSTSRIGSG
jgi:archaellum component FlaF (FlaF/FlaG flagellin family)